MIAIVLAAFLTPPAQEEASVEALLSRIGQGDSRDAFRAISRLSSLPEARRPDVRAGAEKLPSFYREALLSELKLRETLGDHYGQVVRVELEGGKKNAISHLDQLKQASGMKIAPGHWLKRGSDEAFALVGGPRSAMEALADICEKAKHYPYLYGSSTIVLTQSGIAVKPYCFRNFAFFVGSLRMWRKIDFSNQSPWKIHLYCVAVTDPGLEVATWNPEFRLIEAVTDKGVALKQDKATTISALQLVDRVQTKKPTRGSRGFPIILRLAGGSPEKLVRLRGVATAKIARLVRTFTVKEFEPLSEAQAADELFEVSVIDTEGGSQYQPETRVRLLPKTMTPEQLLDLPVRIDLTYQGMGDGQSWVEEKLVEKGVEYRVRWWPQEYRAQPNNQRPKLENLVLTVPMDFVDRPVYVELTDIPLK